MTKVNNPGSSLILVLLIVASIVTIIIGAETVTLAQFGQSRQVADNTQAYYAAKAGIEDGLIRVRYSRDTQTADNMVYRYNLTTGQAGGAADNEILASTSLGATPGPAVSPTDEAYDLSINFKTKSINMDPNSGNVGDMGAKSSYQIKINGDPSSTVDNSIVELSGFSSSDSINFLRYVFAFPNCADTANAFVQIQPISSDGTVKAQVQAKYQPAYPDGRIDSQASNDNLSLNNVTQIRFRSYFCDATFAFAITDRNDSLAASTTANMDSLTTTITATGYYGQSKRTLVGTVDRNTGRLINIFDFTAYSGQGGVAGR